MFAYRKACCIGVYTGICNYLYMYLQSNYFCILKCNKTLIHQVFFFFYVDHCMISTIMNLHADCMILPYVIYGLNDNGNDPFDFIYCITHVKTLWCKLIKQIRRNILSFSFWSNKKYSFLSIHQLILQFLIRISLWKGWVWVACFKIINSQTKLLLLPGLLIIRSVAFVYQHPSALRSIHGICLP